VKLRALALLTAGIAGCGGAAFTPPPIPTQAAALELFNEIVAVVQSGDLNNLCRYGSGTCRKTLDTAEPGSTPRTRPVVVGSRIDESSTEDGETWSIGGRILELCGRDGNGRPYYSEMLIFEADGRLIAKEPVYWVGMRIADSGDVGGAVTPSPEGCAAPG
jgi:hypothetical protein